MRWFSCSDNLLANLLWGGFALRSSSNCLQRLIVESCLCISLTIPVAAQKNKKPAANPSQTSQPSYGLPQAETEKVDLTMYARIRDEGLAHSHVMEYASGLMDGIGGRLTGSPNMNRANGWMRDQLT